MPSSASTASGDERASGAPRDPSAGAVVPPQAHAEWAASMQAFYGGQPYAWHAAQQHIMAAAAAAGASAPFGTPMPFPVSFHPAYYAHAAMATGVPYTASEPVVVAAVEGKSKMKNLCAPSFCSASGSSTFPCLAAGVPDGWHFSGEPSQAATTQDAAAETRSAAKRRSTGKLSVSTPETAAISDARPNLNIGMDLWSNSPVKAETSGQSETNAATLPQHDVALSQMQDERELKRERRKQSNRESARRSRLRKQQECEELAQKVTDLTALNGALRSELDQLKKACEDMEAENSQLMGEMEQSEVPSVATTLSIQIDTSKAHHGNNGQHHNKNNSDS
ncbi:hypothetical protein HU200_013034 [Digitaria exilis]|uniref:BZIP domain-containing protein n=1 Tax=Digitaria exilis TaxID=1010633 RepID=A0A835FE18_9POAL|nr:hypothetical protein HU200_013034 [Digitaria exilis]